jgi:hypothetical protein
MYSRKKVRRNAIVDAKNNIPGVTDPNPSQFEQELMAMSKNEARQVTSKYGLANTSPCSRIMDVSPRTMMRTPPRSSGPSPVWSCPGASIIR